MPENPTSNSHEYFRDFVESVGTSHRAGCFDHPGHRFALADLDCGQNGVDDTGAIYTSASSLLPQDATLFNFQRVLGLANPADPRLAKSGLGNIDFLRALLNSVIFTAMVVIPQILFSSMAAFAFARLRFPGATSFSFFLSRRR